MDVLPPNHYLFYLFISGRQKEKKTVLAFQAFMSKLKFRIILVGYLNPTWKNLALNDFVSMYLRLNAFFFHFQMFIIDGFVFLFTVIPTFRFYIQEDTLSFHIGLMGLSCYTLRVGTEKNYLKGDARYCNR